MAKAKFWGVKMPMSGKNIFKSMTSTSTLETRKKLNTNWSEKKKNSKGKDRIIWNQNRKTKKIYEAKNFIIWEYQ